MQHEPVPDTISVEADTIEDALEAVTERLGPDAEIVSAERSARGGIRGFFAREVVVVKARPKSAHRNPSGATGVDAMLAQMIETNDAQEGTFQHVLRQHLTLQEEEQEMPADPVPPAAAFPGTGPVRWSVSNLASLGVPTMILESTMGLDSSDDLAWINAIAVAVRTSCRPLPSTSFAMVGPSAHRLGRALDLPTVAHPDLPPYGGSIAVTMNSERHELEWLEKIRGDRWLHLVLDGDAPNALVSDDPLAVSWTSEQGIAEALALSATTGAILGYGMTAGRRSAYRATPLDVALALRSALGRW